MVYAIASISFGGLCVDIDQQVEPTELSKKVELLRQLANAKRLQICAILSARELDVRTLAAEVGLSQSALSQHLARLRVSDMVKVRKHGQCRYYPVLFTGLERRASWQADLSVRHAAASACGGVVGPDGRRWKLLGERIGGALAPLLMVRPDGSCGRGRGTARHAGRRRRRRGGPGWRFR
ncbi:ArsR/SmtB family transcription factor [Roseixanthobacter pseudopolyaromaticivorans]